MSYKLLNRFIFFMFILLLFPNLTVFSNNVIVQNYSDFNIIQNIHSERFEGYNLFVYERKSSVDYEIINRTLVISDLDGNLYFKRELDTKGALANFAAEFINSTTILYGDGNGANLWNIYTNDTTALGVYGHHDYEMNYANNTYFTLNCYIVEINGTKYLFDKIVEYNQNAEIIWEKDTKDFVDISQWCPFSDMESGVADLTHSNTVFYDEEDDSIYLNMRNTNTFYKIDHKTGKIIWALGEYGDFVMYGLQGKEKDILFYHGHALEKISNDTFIYFDNDLHNQTDATNMLSRIMEIRINIETMTANVSWEWIAPIEYYSGWWGDADKLPNNNRLGVFGTHSHPNTDLGARIVEVTEEGNIAWDLSFAPIESETFGIYRVERIRFAPYVSEPRIQNISETKKIVEWDIWYNFRSKTEFDGSFKIIIDNKIKKEEEITFPKYWKHLTVNYVLENLTVGEHVVEIVVMDEAGHLSNETEFDNSIGTLTFSAFMSKGLVIGLSVGGSIILVTTLITIWLKIFRKKRIFTK